MAPGPPALTLTFTADARAELREVFNYNAEQRGFARAEQYLAFLIAGIESLSTDYARGKPVEEFPELRILTLKRRRKGMATTLYMRSIPRRAK